MSSRRINLIKGVFLEYLEKIMPSYFDLLLPLKQWKILSLRELKEEAKYTGSFSGFYKIISKLEKNMLLDSFINSWSNEKFLYLLPDGIKALGGNEKSLHINRDLRFHDSLVSKVARMIKEFSFVKDVYMDFQAREVFPLLERVPDCVASGFLKKEFVMAIEVELTQKSQDRVKEIFKTYSASKVVNNVLYITDKKSIFNSYRMFLDELGGEICKEKFLLMFGEDLRKMKSDLKLAPIYFKDKLTNLSEVFKGYL
ncbi:MAG: hypothetical protein A2381_19020 [Bdellovibrionales bacterium RIFOXYB1_FULL_37_110]|nr:MAG: hypothetical protein A2417_13080 [Bdellovibrionales bacterium RIFOXYC1_FULL_37_79]OFZ59885.1 MAG: hypothetical protein A2381_19020 [Bdellovibrionales bacterium RIFOXYB1_FULL_37_110]OFZ63506.1 MAG: hypothetical protein A2577_06470 [Bdellovibrionales bacterium RIFOXYD1_FULL_36_51]